MVTDTMIVVRDEALRLLPERAIYWERTRTVFVADMHLGKTAMHNAYGRPLPQGDTADDLARLTRVMERTGAQKLIVLGDLIHAAKGRDAITVQAFEAWREAHADLKILLIRGNHDRGAEAPESWRLPTVDGPALFDPFILSHAPVVADNGYLLSGHLHPGVELTGKGRQQLRVPCFWFSKQYAVLPAFGSFTGLSVVRPKFNDRIFAVAGESVVPIGPNP